MNQTEPKPPSMRDWPLAGLFRQRGSSLSVFHFLSWLALPVMLMIAPLCQAVDNARQAENRQVLEVFVRDGCPHCANAKLFLQGFAEQRPELRIILRPIDHDANARSDLERYTRNAGIWPPGVPTFVYEDRILVGFQDAGHSGPLLAGLVDRGTRPPIDGHSGQYGSLSVSHIGLPLFTLALGLLDGFNACAMWVLLFLLSLLVHLHDRRRMALVAGTFVLVSGLVYYAFMAAWLNVFQLVDISGALQLGLGIVALAIGAINVKDFLRPGHGISLSIPDAAKPRLYARMRRALEAETLVASLSAIAVLAVMVNLVELLCTAGIPAIYTAILTQQDLDPLVHYAYLGLYILGYVADDMLMVSIAVIALGNRRLSEHSGRWLKLLSGIVMLLLGGIMMLRPEWLT